MSDAEVRRLIQRVKALGSDACAQVAAELCPRAWLVWRGQYSDWEPVAVFLGEAEARAWIAQADRPGDYDTEPLDVCHADVVPGAYRAIVDRDGHPTRIAWGPSLPPQHGPARVEWWSDESPRQPARMGALSMATGPEFVGHGLTVYDAYASAEALRQEWLANGGPVAHGTVIRDRPSDYGVWVDGGVYQDCDPSPTPLAHFLGSTLRGHLPHGGETFRDPD